MRTVWDIIKSPVITEKALVAKEETQDRRQLLTFRVDRRATKPEIKSAVETIFQVKVDEVRTAQYMGKMARRGRFEGRKPSWKKAFVTLKQGERPVDYGEVAAYLKRTRGLDSIDIPSGYYSTWMDNAKAKDCLAWQPQYDLEKLIDSAWTYERSPNDPRKVWYPG